MNPRCRGAWLEHLDEVVKDIGAPPLSPGLGGTRGRRRHRRSVNLRRGGVWLDFLSPPGAPWRGAPGGGLGASPFRSRECAHLPAGAGRSGESARWPVRVLLRGRPGPWGWPPTTGTGERCSGERVLRVPSEPVQRVSLSATHSGPCVAVSRSAGSPRQWPRRPTGRSGHRGCPAAPRQPGRTCNGPWPSSCP